MNLIVTTPFAIVVRAQQVAHVRAEDATGAFGILPHHAEFLTALVPSVLSWRGPGDRQGHCAVRGGVLTVDRDGVSVATREAVQADDLETLEHEVLARFRRTEAVRVEQRIATERLRLAALRAILKSLGRPVNEADRGQAAG
jgi:F-type H+-transporting ATPase subunit epsilon